MVFSGRYHYRNITWGLRGNLSRSGKDHLWSRRKSVRWWRRSFVFACWSLVRILCLAQAFQHFFLLLVLNYGQNHFDDINSILFHEFTWKVVGKKNAFNLVKTCEPIQNRQCQMSLFAVSTGSLIGSLRPIAIMVQTVHKYLQNNSRGSPNSKPPGKLRKNKFATLAYSSNQTKVAKRIIKTK